MKVSVVLTLLSLVAVNFMGFHNLGACHPSVLQLKAQSLFLLLAGANRQDCWIPNSFDHGAHALCNHPQQLGSATKQASTCESMHVLFDLLSIIYMRARNSYLLSVTVDAQKIAPFCLGPRFPPRQFSTKLLTTS